MRPNALQGRRREQARTNIRSICDEPGKNLQSRGDLVKPKDAAMPVSVQPVVSDEKLPGSADVVVIGAGIAGSAAAYFLAKKGVSVALLAKATPAAPQTPPTSPASPP